LVQEDPSHFPEPEGIKKVLRRFLGSIGEELAENTIRRLDQLQKRVNVLEQELRELNKIESKLVKVVGEHLEHVAEEISWKCLDPSLISAKLASSFPHGVCMNYHLDKWDLVKLLLFLEVLTSLLEQGAGRVSLPGAGYADKLVLTKPSVERASRSLEAALDIVMPTAVVEFDDERSYTLWLEKPIPKLSFVPTIAIARGSIDVQRTGEGTSIVISHRGQNQVLWKIVRAGRLHRISPGAIHRLKCVIHAVKSSGESKRCVRLLKSAPISTERYRVIAIKERDLVRLKKIIGDVKNFLAELKWD